MNGNLSRIWLNLYAIYCYFILSNRQKKDPREYYKCFFPYSLKVKELIRAPENSCLLSFVFFLLKNQHVKKTYTEAIEVNICRKDAEKE